MIDMKPDVLAAILLGAGLGTTAEAGCKVDDGGTSDDGYRRCG